MVRWVFQQLRLWRWLPTEAASRGTAPVYGFTFPLVLLAAAASSTSAPAKIHLVAPISPLGFVV